MTGAGLRVAVIGSGPAGFFAAGRLLTAGAHVDLFERLPTPWGLVRLGVAPDHPQIKAVSRVFEKTASHPGFRFFGNVEIGHHLSRDDLRRHYHAVIWSVGAQVERRIGIPGEDLPGSLSGAAFVAWYNGHPDYQDLEPGLNVRRVLVVGNGNVALDCARMLALTRKELQGTDATDEAIEAIASSPIEEIVIVGRRGPAQAAFTTAELVDLGQLAGADVLVAASDIELDAAGAAALDEEQSQNRRRNLAVLEGYAQRAPTGRPRVIRLRFLVSPLELRGNGRVEQVVLGRNRLARGTDGALRTHATGLTESLDCGLVLRSVGYRGAPLPGVPFDPSRHVIPNSGGRVLDKGGRVVRGEYCAGWIKRGPSGVIGTNKKDATESVELLLADAAAGHLATPAEAAADAIRQLIAERSPDAIEYAGWEAIDALERDRGAASGRPRVKLTRWDELLTHGRGGTRRH